MVPPPPFSAHNKKKQTINSAVLFLNNEKPEAARMLKVVSSLLKARKVRVWVGASLSVREKLRLADIAIGLGGDGTMLRAARILAPHSIPLLGVNVGGLGFLSGTDAADFRRHCDAILRGDWVLEERWMLEVSVYRKEKRIFGPSIALNDCVIRCGDQARAISLKARSGEDFVADYFGDGLIVSTPTGSTAYALAAMGPIVDPRLNVLLIAPICPHTLTQRPLIVPAADPFSVQLLVRRMGETPQTLMSVDGQLGCSLKVGDEVRLRRFEKPLRLLMNPDRSYYEILRRKLKWGER